MWAAAGGKEGEESVLEDRLPMRNETIENIPKIIPNLTKYNETLEGRAEDNEGTVSVDRRWSASGDEVDWTATLNRRRTRADRPQFQEGGIDGETSADSSAGSAPVVSFH